MCNDTIHWHLIPAVTPRALQFMGATSYNRAMHAWDVSSVTDMSKMVRLIPCFVSGLLTRYGVKLYSNTTTPVLFTVRLPLQFMGATDFTRTLDPWNVTNVLSFRSMFEGTSYYRDLSPWKMTSAVDVDRMFYNDSRFNQYLCSWGNSIPMNASVEDMFHGTACQNTADPRLTAFRFSMCSTGCTTGSNQEKFALLTNATLTAASSTSGLTASITMLVAIFGFLLRRKFRTMKRKTSSLPTRDKSTSPDLCKV